jgi:hydrogenase maturation protein HypF
MPYDRPNTSLAAFELCPACAREYTDPRDRRFHAQPLACPVCGPRLDRPVEEAASAIEAGRIVAVKGVGGYHLLCDAAQDDAIYRLRERKHRPHKPLAVMFPLQGEDDLDSVRKHLVLDSVTREALLDPARPIVLLPRGTGFNLSEILAPGLSEIGAFLPYSPLHHLLLQRLCRPVVATSGNLSGEPVIIDNDEADRRLAHVADEFLHHDRPIVRPADDSVLRPMAGAARAIRLGRGIAPLERELPGDMPQTVLAVGGHLKVTTALAWARRVVVSPHIGELDSPRSEEVFKQVINDLTNIYQVKPDIAVCDMHPRYSSSRWAEQSGLPLIRVQHHRAHASALAGEHPDVARWLVFAWDGVGQGDDGSLWGGEAFTGAPGQWQRAASFRPFGLVGGDKAGREPWRSAAALMWADNRDWNPPVDGAGLARQAWAAGRGRHESSAVGRLFDAAASLILRRHACSFEGQGPMELEHLAAAYRGGEAHAVALPLNPDQEGLLRADWSPLLGVLVDDSMSPGFRAALFHESMAFCLLDQALAVRELFDFDAVGLSGGVFQNRWLTERVVSLLAGHGIPVRLHRDIPANDGGLSFGQIVEAQAILTGTGDP